MSHCHMSHTLTYVTPPHESSLCHTLTYSTPHICHTLTYVTPSHMSHLTTLTYVTHESSLCHTLTYVTHESSLCHTSQPSHMSHIVWGPAPFATRKGSGKNRTQKSCDGTSYSAPNQDAVHIINYVMTTFT